MRVKPIIDPKAVSMFKPFEGEESKWSDWKFHAMGSFGVLWMKTLVDAVGEQTESDLMYGNLDEDVQPVALAL